MESSIIGYKIKNTRLDIYSMGGVNPYFNNLGKLWKNLGYIKTHIAKEREQDEMQEYLRLKKKYDN